MPNILFYLSVSPELYEPIIDNIGAGGLVSEGHRWCSLNAEATPWQRIIVEKPFGNDLASAVSLNRALGRVFEEEETYRIDHYLGKELVQNIAVMRFANTIFEPIWNRDIVEHVQVTAAETVGVGSRAANFYDRAGALRDMVQSHLLQVMCMVAMEPPSVFDADAIMREKIKLLGSCVVASDAEAPAACIMGRYGRGKGPDDRAYVEEEGVDPKRNTDTYAAVRLRIDNWRLVGRAVLSPLGQEARRQADRGRRAVPQAAGAHLPDVQRLARRPACKPADHQHRRVKASACAWRARFPGWA